MACFKRDRCQLVNTHCKDKKTNCLRTALGNNCCYGNVLKEGDISTMGECQDDAPDSDSRLHVYLESPDENEDNTHTDKLSSSGHYQDGIRYRLVVILSGLYGLMLSVLGLVIPITQSFLMPTQSYLFEMFYIYLYTVSMMFLVFVYLFLLHQGSDRLKTFASAVSITKGVISRTTDSISSGSACNMNRKRKHVRFTKHKACDTGSFYLRLGAVGFGIGSMILDGLYVGQYVEAQTMDSLCDDPMQAVKPLSKFFFTFSQLYFIFRNSKLCIMKFPYVARFGLMHMSITNICVWLRVIVVETLHSFHEVRSSRLEQEHKLPETSHNIDSHETMNNDSWYDMHHTVNQSLPCQWSNLLGGILQTATPYLYPFSIEYSVICAGILYVMWNNVGGQPYHSLKADNRDTDSIDNIGHRMSIDCAGSSRGLFLGILVFVASVMSLIIFYVLIHNNSFNHDGILIVHLSEITMYSVATFSTVAAGVRMRNLCFRKNLDDNLEQNLILISVTGLFMFSFFSILAGMTYINTMEGSITIVTNLICMTQATLQTLFMLVGLRMSASNATHVQNKDGREFVTFLLICNFSLWLINTFETQKTAHNPLQLKVYGHKAWTVFTHISVPLGIFYRFHSTVCLSNIWKHAWKMKNT